MPPMDSTQFQSLLGNLDQRIEQVRRRQSQKAEREEIERCLAAVREQVGSLQPRIRILDELGDREAVESLQTLLDTLRTEEGRLYARIESLDRELSPLPALPAPRPDPPPITSSNGAHRTVGSPEDIPDEVEMRVRDESRELLEGIVEAIPNLSAFTTEERGLTLELWSLQWRILKEESESYAPRADGLLRKVFATIRETMATYADAPYLEALNPRRTGNWAEERDRVRARLAERSRRAAARATPEPLPRQAEAGA
ncbi:MAG: hypothetical protein HYY93_02600 [Planctomycetes bacterium]|nr:hypothetical protein [Planctomycetota bacterium]